MSKDADSHQSSYRERLLEHLFIGDVLRELWLAGFTQVEVLKSEVDGAGYDVVFEVHSVVRHVQLKSSRLGAKRAHVDIQLKLAEKPAGCVIWMFFDPETLRIGPFLWFGGAPGQSLPDMSSFKPARHSKGDSSGYKAERPNLRLVPKGRFEKLDTISELIERLFGNSAPG